MVVEQFEVIPRLSRLSLRNVYCWRALDITFGPGLNIFTERDSAFGLHAIFRAILLGLSSSHRACYPGYPEAKSPGFARGQISLETFGVPLRPPKSFASEEDPSRSYEENLVSTLRTVCPMVRGTDDALLIDEMLFAIASGEKYFEARDLINQLDCQVICRISHGLKVEDFPNARIFEAVVVDDDIVEIELLQAGAT